MSGLKLTEYVPRPAPGKLGKPIKVRTNFFEVQKLPDIMVHHYDVTVTPDVPPVANRKVFQQFITTYGDTELKGARPVYDGRKNLFSARDLGFDGKTFDITLGGDVHPNPKRPIPVFKLKIKKAATINLEEIHQFLNRKAALSNNILTGIMALDVLIRHQPSMLYATVGRSFFTPEGKSPLSGPLDVWRGFYQSARPTAGKMMINLDISATAFYQSGPLLNIIVKIMNLRGLDDLRRPQTNWQKVEKSIKGLRVTVNHRERSKRPFKIFGLTVKSAKDHKFSLESKDGKAAAQQTSVEAYFKSTYNIKLQFPTLPCVQVGKTACVPLELCSVIEGQRYPKKLDAAQTSDMIKFTCQPPEKRANIIKDGLKILNYDRNEYLKDFGLKISTEMATVNARFCRS
ncbi:eukaryotic translation initiation factor 2C, 2 [Modicella reniformis]|uniref:Eukaryotic translation initiation factor 2C, 2 n=1 Tax=Modicella reniformis TaxID=1440133 RepID=A0A9P6IRE7_9FUNG|nr:eukaryotic translation initiation factor 2C, 2 [Modicella reniformis]